MCPTTHTESGRGAGALPDGALIFAALSFFYLFSFGGVFRVDDEHILAARAQSLALWGTLDQPQVEGNLRVRELTAYGDAAIQIEPGQAVLGAALYTLGTHVGGGAAQALFVMNLLATAATGAVVFATVMRLGWRRGTGLWCAALFGLGTMAWPYSTTYYRDVLAMLAASLAFFAWACALRTRGIVHGLALGGAALAVAAGAFAKNISLALIVAFAPVVIFAGSNHLGARQVRLRSLAAGAGVLGLGIFVLSMVPERGPLARYSLDYLAFLAGHARQSVGKELLLAVSGPFVSPSKSVFLFSPPLVLALLSVRGAWKSEWRFVLPALLLPVALALFQGLFYRDLWAGAYGWGLRFMLPALPALLVLCAPLVDAIALQPGRSARWPLWLTLAAGGLIQASGAWVPWIASYQAWSSRGLDPYAPGAAWTARFLLIPGQLERLLDPNTWTLAWLRLRSAGDQRAAVLGFAALVMSFACLVVLVRAPRSIGGRSRNVAAGSLLAASLILPLWPNLSLLRSDPEWDAGRPQHEQALEWLRSSVTEGDCLLLDSYATPLWFFWMNRWDQPVPWTSLPFEIPGSAVSALGESARRIQSRAACSQGRVWYLTSTESPTYGVRHLEGKAAIPADFNLQAVFGQARRVEIWAFSPPR